MSTPIKSASLYFKSGGSDKEYHVQIETDRMQSNNSDYRVNFQYGRRGAALTAGTKTGVPVTLAEAEKIFDKLVKEKTGKGYTPGEAGWDGRRVQQGDRGRNASATADGNQRG